VVYGNIRRGSEELMFMARFRWVYKTPKWEAARQAVIARAHGLCEECLRHGRIEAGKEVHHIIELTEENWRDWRVAYDPDNLELLCADCHNQKHGRCTGLAAFVEPVG
jgi:5-methylcytosine-specific restriction protein A